MINSLMSEYLKCFAVYLPSFVNDQGEPVTLTGVPMTSGLKDRSESPGSSCDGSEEKPADFSDEPGPSDLK